MNNHSDNEHVQQIRRLFTNAESLKIFDKHSAKILKPTDTMAESTINDASNPIQMLCESLDAETRDHSNFSGNSLPHLDIDSLNSSNDYDSSNAEQPDLDTQLFAPEESSNGELILISFCETYVFSQFELFYIRFH